MTFIELFGFGENKFELISNMDNRDSNMNNKHSNKNLNFPIIISHKVNEIKYNLNIQNK
jgi:hypothetical protein